MAGSGGLFWLLLAGMGLVGFYRAVRYRRSYFSIWHGLVFLAVPFIFWWYFTTTIRLPAFAVFGVSPILVGLWCFSAIEVYNATEPNSRSTNVRQYLRLLGLMVLLGVGTGAVIHFLIQLLGSTRA